MNAEELDKVSVLFNHAEAKLKLIERLHSQELVVPSVNELRYAGFHIIQALSAPSPETEKENWQRAANHCKRAIYDALEVGVLDRLEAFKQFEIDYRLVEIPLIIPSYIDLRTVARKAQQLIADLENIEAYKDRDRYYQDIENHFNELNDAVDKITDARPELNKILNNRRKQFYLILVGIAATIFAGLLSVILPLYLLG
ncbi:MAG: hypothetical protein QG599_3508 [Pseudomonadota bacterium]|nr:hypothetical protein [Pseudomonadota bacterium]